MNFFKKYRNVIIFIIILILVFTVFTFKILENKKQISKETIQEENLVEYDYKLYSFTLDDSSSSESMENIYQAAKEKYNDKIDFEYLNVEKDYKISNKYNITLAPTYLIVDKNGIVLKRKVGAMSKEEFFAFLESVIIK